MFYIEKFQSELDAIRSYCEHKGISFNFIFRGSKYAAYKLKPDGCNVIRIDDDYFVLPNTTHLMIRRFLIALRKGDLDIETLFHL
jgi:hypothetical protein|nr:MAG TPA: hypothetical protein [Microviridae sp.]